MLNGAVFYTLLLLDYSVKLLPPSSLKKFATGNGRASKEEIRKVTPLFFIQEVERVFKKSDDIFDAYWLARKAKDYNEMASH
jgi:Holliday junction resolvasome RuvABC endonuclease subunit